MASKRDQLAGVQRLGQQVLHRRRDAAAGRLAPAPLEELGQPFLQPDRRAVAGQRRDRVVDQLVVDAVEPGVAVGERARRGHHQARPLAERDRPGARHLRLRQRRHRREVGRAAIELDADRELGVEAEVVVQRLVRRLQRVARVGHQHRVLGRVADDDVRGALLLVILDGVARLLGQLGEQLDVGAGVGASARRSAQRAAPRRRSRRA